MLCCAVLQVNDTPTFSSRLGHDDSPCLSFSFGYPLTCLFSSPLPSPPSPTHSLNTSHCCVTNASPVQEDYKFYGVFDGHCGTRAAKFASRALHLNLELFLNAQDTRPPPPAAPPSTKPPPRAPSSPTNNNSASIERAVREAFRKTQSDFLDSAHPSPPLPPSGDDGHPDRDVAGRSEAGTGAGGGVEDDSGTTATVALVYADVTVVAHVGDSRAVLCCDAAGRAVEITEGGWVGCLCCFGRYNLRSMCKVGAPEARGHVDSSCSWDVDFFVVQGLSDAW